MSLGADFGPTRSSRRIEPLHEDDLSSSNADKRFEAGTEVIWRIAHRTYELSRSQEIDLSSIVSVSD
jgi:hypothetical protein